MSERAIGRERVASLEARLYDLIGQDDATLSQTLKRDRSWLYMGTTLAHQEVVFAGDIALIQGAIDLGNSADRRHFGILFEGIDSAENAT